MPARWPGITRAERRKGERRKEERRKTPNPVILGTGTVERIGRLGKDIANVEVDLGRRDWKNQKVLPESERRNYNEPGKTVIMARTGTASGLKPGDQATTTRRELADRGFGALTVERRQRERRKDERRTNIKLRKRINEVRERIDEVARRKKGAT